MENFSIQLYFEERLLNTESTLKAEALNEGGYLLVKISNAKMINLCSIGLTSLLQFRVKDFVNLKYLDLSKNKLTEIPEKIAMLQNLQYLNLSGNLLKFLPVHMENLVSLRVLDVKNNFNLSCLPITLASLQKLRTIFIGSTNIKEITPDFLPFVENGGRFDIGAAEIDYPPLEKPELAEFVVLDANLNKDYQYAVVKKRLVAYWTAIIESHVLNILNSVAVALLGRTGAGKTTFSRSLLAGAPAHAEQSTVGFEIPIELKLGDSMDKSVELHFNILDLAGQECYGILHTILLGARHVSRKINMLIYVLVNASEYYTAMDFQNDWSLNQNFMKHCGIWVNTALSIDPFACLKLVITHSDVMGNLELQKVVENLEDGYRKLINDRITFVKCETNSISKIAHLDHLVRTFSIIQFACYKVKNPLNEKKFLSGLEASTNSLREDFKKIEFSTSYPFVWHPVVNYLIGCASRFSDALLSANYMKKRFPQHANVMNSILDYMDRRGIIHTFPQSDYFCPSTYHLQKLCRMAVDHTMSDQIMCMMPNLQGTGNIPIKILRNLWGNDQNSKKTLDSQMSIFSRRAKVCSLFFLLLFAVGGIVVGLGLGLGLRSTQLVAQLEQAIPSVQTTSAQLLLTTSLTTKTQTTTIEPEVTKLTSKSTQSEHDRDSSEPSSSVTQDWVPEMTSISQPMMNTTLTTNAFSKTTQTEHEPGSSLVTSVVPANPTSSFKSTKTSLKPTIGSPTTLSILNTMTTQPTQTTGQTSIEIGTKIYHSTTKVLNQTRPIEYSTEWEPIVTTMTTETPSSDTTKQIAFSSAAVAVVVVVVAVVGISIFLIKLKRKFTHSSIHEKEEKEEEEEEEEEEEVEVEEKEVEGEEEEVEVIINDDQVSLKSLIPTISTEELFNLKKDILTDHFLCCQVTEKSDFHCYCPFRTTN